MFEARGRLRVAAGSSPATVKVTIPHFTAPRSCTVAPVIAARLARSTAAGLVTRSSIAVPSCGPAQAEVEVAGIAVYLEAGIAGTPTFT
jgi:hypothetical protein